jgi:hypothetical protein
LEKLQQQKKLRTEDVFSSSSDDQDDGDGQSGAGDHSRSPNSCKPRRGTQRKHRDNSRSASSHSDDASSSCSESDVEAEEDQHLKRPIQSKEELSRITLNRNLLEKYDFWNRFLSQIS